MNIKDIKKDSEGKMKKAVEAVRREFNEVRTGRAHPGLFEGMHIEYYGTPTLLKQVASISVADPRTIVIQPWDKNALPEIEKAVQGSKLGLTPFNDGNMVRISIPQLSGERRQELIKAVKDMAEHGRISLRTIRREANDRVKKGQADKLISEDEAFRGQDEIQKLTDIFIKDVEKILEDKQGELLEK